MQLVAYGAQDVYLTGSPQITYFKVVYRRHTNFSIECIEVPIENGNFGNHCDVQILRNGDLANKMYLKTTLPALSINMAYIHNVGHALIRNIECTIGGSRIDKHCGLLYDVWYQLTHKNEKEDGYNKMIGNVPELTDLFTYLAPNMSRSEYTIYVPIQFWFNRNVGLSLPLIALQYHEVRFFIEFEKLSNLINTDPGSIIPSDYKLSNTSLLVDYIYLDQEERRRMAQVGHEYLIEQVQTNDVESIIGSSQKFLLNFNHPCKEIVWATRCSLYNRPNIFLTMYNGNVQETLDYAALNICQKMLSYLTPAEELANLYTLNDGWHKLTDLMGEDPTIPANTTREYIIDNNSYSLPRMHLIVKNNTNANQTFNTYNTFYINDKYFEYDNKYLSRSIKEVTYGFSIEEDIDTNIKIRPKAYAGWQSDKLLMNIKHILKIEDVSIPVDYFTVPTTYNQIYNNNLLITQPFNYGLDLAGNGNLVSTAKIQLNGHDRFETQSGNYFNYVQPFQHHTRTPPGGIYCYSFGLLPEQHQPSGTCNLSRIDTAILLLTFADNLRSRNSGLMQVSNIIKNSQLLICVGVYNVLRIMSGMSGVAYAN